LPNTTGTIDFITSSGLITPIDNTPTPLFAVLYAAPIPEPPKKRNSRSKPLDPLPKLNYEGRITKSITLEPPNRRRRRTGAAEPVNQRTKEELKKN